MIYILALIILTSLFLQMNIAGLFMLILIFGYTLAFFFII